MGSLFSGTPGPTPEERALSSAQSSAVKLGVEGAKTDLPAARAAINLPADYFKKLLTGDRTALTETLSPEITTLHKQYETGRRTTEEFAPRGGGRTALMSELPFKEAADVSTLVHGARKEGASGMLDIGKILADLGVGEMGGAVSGANAGASRLSAERIAQGQISAQQQQEAGQAAGALLAAWLFA